MADWQQLISSSEIERILESSFSRPQMIFKHSTRCGISMAAKDRLEYQLGALSSQMDLHYLDLLNFRPISKEVADIFSIPHQSPQILLIVDGKATLNLTHYGITAEKLLQATS